MTTGVFRSSRLSGVDTWRRGLFTECVVLTYSGSFVDAVERKQMASFSCLLSPPIIFKEQSVTFYSLSPQNSHTLTVINASPSALLRQAPRTIWNSKMYIVRLKTHTHTHNPILPLKENSAQIPNDPGSSLIELQKWCFSRSAAVNQHQTFWGGR